MREDTYTYVAQYGNKILSRGYTKDGMRFDKKEDFYPTLFTSSRKGAEASSPWKDLYGNTLYEIKPGTIKECREFIDQYKEVHGFTVMGMTSWVTQFISEEYQHEVKLNPKFTRVAILDIETSVEHGFPNVETAQEEILLITLYDSITNAYTVYTSRPISDSKRFRAILEENAVDPRRVVVSLHQDEYHMLKAFVIDWATNYPDVLTGWNTEFFDVPYLVNRIAKVLGGSFTNKLSPWGIVRDRMIRVNAGDEALTFDLIGINHLDFIQLMKKFTYGGRDSWKLDNVAKDELGKSKLDFDGTFKDHYSGSIDVTNEEDAAKSEINALSYKRHLIREELARRGLRPRGA